MAVSIVSGVVGQDGVPAPNLSVMFKAQPHGQDMSRNIVECVACNKINVFSGLENK